MEFLSWFSARERRRRAAARWLARMQGEDAERLRERFDRWRSNPDNAAAYQGVSRSFDAAAVLRLSSQDYSLPPPGIAEPESWTPSRLALAATVALLLAVPAALFLPGAGYFSAQPALLMVSTGVGEIRTIQLSDGSKIMLDTNSALEYEPGKRPGRAILRRGRARFIAASADRPFQVTAAGTKVEAGGAMFDISLAKGDVTVSSVTGIVSLRTGQEKARVGEGASVIADGDVLKPIGARDPDWPSGMLEFDNETLASAVGRANRYSAKQIHMPDLEVQRLRVTGVYRIGDPDGLARSLAIAFGLEVARRPNGDPELRPRS